MGSCYYFCCSNCGYSKLIQTGKGFMYSPTNINTVQGEAPLIMTLVKSKKIFNAVKDLIEHHEGEIVWPYYNWTLYRCMKCGEFCSRFHFLLEHLEGTYQPPYKCWRCKGELVPLHVEKAPLGTKDWYDSVRIQKYPCPKCGKYKLNNECSEEAGDFEYFNWD